VLISLWRFGISISYNKNAFDPLIFSITVSPAFNLNVYIER